MKNSLPNVQSLLNHSALSISQSNYDVSAFSFSIAIGCLSVDQVGTLLKGIILVE